MTSPDENIALNEIITYLALGTVGIAVAFIFVMDLYYKKVKRFNKDLKYGKEQAEKRQAEETKKAGRINSRGRW